MSIINTNQPTFFGNNGEVLANGYIYIGLPNQEPVAFPKTVTFTDAGGTETTAVQPLRTNAQGCIQFNGNAIKATTDGDYSMLRLDSTGTQIKNGYTKLIEADASSQISLDNYTENGLLLADVKQLDKTPGQTVRSIGKISAQDGLGALWLVVTDTGNPADDIDLIDFDNGTQGERLKNYLGAGDNLQEIADAGASAQATARDNLGLPDYEEVSSTALDGGFTIGDFKAVRIGKQITISCSLFGHSSSASVVSDSGVIPSDFRPSETARNTFTSIGGIESTITVSTSGTVTVTYSSAQLASDGATIGYVA